MNNYALVESEYYPLEAIIVTATFLPGSPSLTLRVCSQLGVLWEAQYKIVTTVLQYLAPCYSSL